MKPEELAKCHQTPSSRVRSGYETRYYYSAVCDQPVLSDLVLGFIEAAKRNQRDGCSGPLEAISDFSWGYFTAS